MSVGNEVHFSTRKCLFRSSRHCRQCRLPSLHLSPRRWGRSGYYRENLMGLDLYMLLNLRLELNNIPVTPMFVPPFEQRSTRRSLKVSRNKMDWTEQGSPHWLEFLGIHDWWKNECCSLLRSYWENMERAVLRKRHRSCMCLVLVLVFFVMGSFIFLDLGT